MTRNILFWKKIETWTPVGAMRTWKKYISRDKRGIEMGPSPKQILVSTKPQRPAKAGSAIPILLPVLQPEYTIRHIWCMTRREKTFLELSIFLCPRMHAVITELIAPPQSNPATESHCCLWSSKKGAQSYGLSTSNGNYSTTNHIFLIAKILKHWFFNLFSD